MAGTMADLFSPTPFKSTKSNVPTSALGAISKATTLQDENPFDSITQPLRKRKRRQVAEDLAKRGVQPGTPEYFEQFRDKLIEFGDMEGAETVENKRQETIDQDIKRRKAEADIVNVNSTVSSRDRGADRDDEVFAFKKLKTARELDQAAERIDIAAQNANTNEARNLIQRARVGLERRRVELAESNNALNQEGQRLDNEQQRLTNEILGRTDSLPGKPRASGAGAGNGVFGQGGSDPTSLIDEALESLLNPGSGGLLSILPGDNVSGIEGSLKASSLGSMLKQLGIPIDDEAAALKATMGIIQAQLTEPILNERKVTDTERKRIDQIVGTVSAGVDNQRARRLLTELRTILNKPVDTRTGRNRTSEPTSDTNSIPSIPNDRVNFLKGKYNLGN